VGRERGEPERISFRHGQLHSNAAAPLGFAAGTYQAVAEGGVLRFEAEVRSSTEGTLSWRGTVRDASLEATFTWTKPGERPLEYWVRARER
jgi:hypothetical protein